MRATDVVHLMLTALFAAAAGHAVYRGVMSYGVGWRGRGDQLLHTAMALTMAVMPWSREALLPHPVGTVFFTTAALWFPLTAVRRRHEARLGAVAGRLPFTAGMAAMAWMITGAHPESGPRQEDLAGPPTAALPAPMPGHAAHTSTIAHMSTIAQATTVVLALYLLTCALWSLVRLMPTLHPTTGKPYEHFWNASMALGTTIMLLMPH